MGLSFIIRNAISGLSLKHVCDGHAAGSGSLIAATADTVTWTAPGDAVGTAVTIANGEQKIIKSDDTTYWIVVERTSTSDLSGTATVAITTAKTTAELIAETDAALSRALEAQTAGMGDDRISIANLTELRKFKARLEKRLARENNTGGGAAVIDMRSNF